MTALGISRRFVAVAALALIAGVSVFGARVVAQDDASSETPAAEVTEMPLSTGIEETYGIRVTRVSVIGEGGMVEMRYQLIDADLANVIHDDDLEYGDDFPKIVAGHITLAVPTFHHHGGDLVTGREFSILYANSDGTIQPGSLVSVHIGDERLEQIPVS